MQCGTNEPSRPVDYRYAGWDKPDNLANTHYNSRKAAQARARNPLTLHITAETMAHDLDLLRTVPGDYQHGLYP